MPQVSFEGIQPAVYFARFSRWLVQELLAECATKFEQWERSPELAMDAQDGHASSMLVEKVQRELDLNLKGCLTSSRSFMNGDSVFITFLPQQQSAHTAWTLWCRVPGVQIVTTMSTVSL